MMWIDVAKSWQKCGNSNWLNLRVHSTADIKNLTAFENARKYFIPKK